jgi:hypothetical protein
MSIFSVPEDLRGLGDCFAAAACFTDVARFLSCGKDNRAWHPLAMYDGKRLMQGISEPA